MKKVTYTIRTEGDLVVVTTIGTQTDTTIEAMRSAIEPLMKEKPSRDVLLMLAAQKQPTLAGIRAGLKLVQEVPFGRAAVVGMVPGPLGAAKGIAAASKFRDRIKIFRNEEDARAWLEEVS